MLVTTFPVLISKCAPGGSLPLGLGCGDVESGRCCCWGMSKLLEFWRDICELAL